MSIPNNPYFRYIEDVPISPEQEKHIETILYKPIEDLSELTELVEDESADYYREDHGLEQ